MWATGTTQMIARLTGSTLFANHNLVSILTFDHRSLTTTSDKTSSSSDNLAKNLDLITKMRDLRARSPYALFIKENYSEISSKHPSLKLVDISRKAAEIWKSLPDEKKQTYAKKAQDQKASYEQEKKRLSADDLQTVDADEKSRRIEQRVKKSIQQLPTKRPRSAYAHFLTTLTRGEADIKDFMRGASQQWSKLSTEDKQHYEGLHQEEKRKYLKALVAWASSNEQISKPKPRRSTSLASTKTKDVSAKKTRAASATGKKRAVKKRATDSSKSVASATSKSTKSKSSKTKSDKDTSSSSSDDESASKKSTTSKK